MRKTHTIRSATICLDMKNIKRFKLMALFITKQFTKNKYDKHELTTSTSTAVDSYLLFFTKCLDNWFCYSISDFFENTLFGVNPGFSTSTIFVET